MKYRENHACMKPSDAVGDPSLVIFSDASNDAYGSCAYMQGGHDKVEDLQVT